MGFQFFRPRGATPARISQALISCLRKALEVTLCIGGAVLLVACASAPDSQPGRIGFPGERDDDDTAPDTPIEVVIEDDDENAFLFEAVQAALVEGDWLRAQLALPTMEMADTDAPVTTLPGDGPETAPVLDERDPILGWIRYYEARIAWLRGDLELHETLLASLASRPVSTPLRRELLLHQLRIAQAAGNARREVTLSLALKALGGHPDYPHDACEASLWQAVQHLDRDAVGVLRRGADEELAGWLDLAVAAQADSGRNAAAAIGAWLAQYETHPARERAERLREGALGDATMTQFALLLPLSGPLASAADAVSRGFLAAYYADRTRQVAIDVIDSRRFPSVTEAYRAAVERGATVVVGPLGKVQVTELAAASDLPVPLLTLNRPNSGPAPGKLLLSLAPEDEAWQLASQAFARGGRRALLIRPEGVWGDRMENALRSRWEPLGGKIVSTARYGKADTHSSSVHDALSLDASSQRTGELRPLFQERVESPGRRREDLDAIFLLSKGSDDARSLKPLIEYHYAGDLPVYAISTADTGSDAADLNRDLRGLSMLAMPWRLDGEVPGLGATDRTGSLAALHALGADAYRIAGNWQRMASGAGLVLDGFTATLTSDEMGILQRELKMAEINRGALTAR